MASTKIALSLVRHATASAQLVPSVLNLMPAYSLPVSLGRVSVFSSSHSARLMADLRLYRSHSPRRWMLKSMGSSPISSATLRSVKMVPRLGFV